MRRRSLLKAGLAAAAESAVPCACCGLFSSAFLTQPKDAAAMELDPLPRSISQTKVLFGDGGCTYGPFDGLKIFDVEDVVVYSRFAGQLPFCKTVVSVSKENAVALDSFTVTFPANIPATTQFVVSSIRMPMRYGSIRKSGGVDLGVLENELLKIGTIQQELRRDVDRALLLPLDQDPETRPEPSDNKLIGWREGKIANFDAESLANIVVAASSQLGLQASRRFNDYISIGDEPFGAVGDWDPRTSTGSDSSQAAADATTAAKTQVYIPPGNYLLNGYGAYAGMRNAGSWGPGKLFLKIGTSVERLGKFFRVGVPDPDGLGGARTQGGILFNEDEGGYAPLLYPEGPQLLNVVPIKEGGTLEFQVYSANTFCSATAIVGTTRIQAVAAGTFDERVEVGDLCGWNGSFYRVKTKNGNTVIELEGPNGEALANFASAINSSLVAVWFYQIGFCDTNGTMLTWRGGDLFGGFGGAPFGQSFVTVNGQRTKYLSGGGKACTVDTNLGVQSNVPFIQKAVPGSQHRALFRLQAGGGGSEETGQFYLDMLNRVWLSTQRAGVGKMPSLILATGDNDDRLHSPKALTIDIDGKTYFNEKPAYRFPKKAQHTISSFSANRQGANSDYRVLERYYADFVDGGARYTQWESWEEFSPPGLQAYQQGDTAALLRLNPRGGGVGVGYFGSVPIGAALSWGGGALAPASDNTYSVGVPGYRPSVIFAATSTISTSDERSKDVLGSSDLGLDFINALDPIRYRFKSGGTVFAEELEEYWEEQPVCVDGFEERLSVELVNGKAVTMSSSVKVQVPVHDRFPMVDEEGITLLDDKGRPRFYEVERREKVKKTRPIIRTEERVGSRIHYGFSAQQVKAVLDAAGIEDFAGWTLDDKDDPDSQQGLRYEQFIAPLVAAVQTLSARIDKLQARIDGCAPHLETDDGQEVASPK